MGEQIRCFVAVPLPDHVREAVRATLAKAAASIRGIAWVKPELLHVTMRFLGDVERARVPAVAAALDAALANGCPFPLCLRGAGAFPSPARPRVIWIGAAGGAAELTALARTVEEALVPLGFPPESRPFAAHITVGRVKSAPQPPGAVTALVGELRDRSWGDLVVREAQLLRSELFPGGPRYSILHTMCLRAASTPAERTNQ